MSSYIVHGAEAGRTKQRGPLDVALLCSKLETYKIEKDLAQARRQTRRAIARRQSGPRTGATNVVESTGSTTQSEQPQKLQHISRTTVAGSTISISETPSVSQLSHVPLDINFGEKLVLSLPEQTSDASRAQKYGTAPIERERNPAFRREYHASSMPGSRARRPSDYEKCRNTVTSTTGKQASRMHPKSEQPSSVGHRESHAAGAGRQAPISNATSGHSDAKPSSQLKRSSYTRHNWAQASQNGEVMAGSWTSKPRTGRNFEPRGASMNAAENHAFSSGPKDGKDAAGRSTQQEDRLISDAVKRMKEKEKTKRRTSLLGLFKKS
ncbi:unnamed protein product [Zymoseptoria tritici ST99CH_3D7]|uniref:Uncharacterized protein n=1 Tax=Zymoseptoria tritici (strain ST99CH_3D7) TaxID=1276538 RepID=A0A1X7RFR8_ZYMT9|nr:unnamed protein product [Zymoseptoria tritici ST99CH_3D7]